MLGATRRWFKRNRANLAIGAGVLGAGYLAGQYVVSKLMEARQRMSDDRIAKENLRRRFQQNQEDCSFTVLAILPTATENILEALPVEDTLAELQKQKSERIARSGAGSEAASSVGILSGPGSTTDDDARGSLPSGSESFMHTSQLEQSIGDGVEGREIPPQPLRSKKSKLQLWGDMKVNSIARSFTLLYTLALLTLLTRIQLNLLGRRNYLASVVSLAAPQRPEPRITLEDNDDDNFERAYGNDFETNRKYLSFSWWLLHKGCKDLMETVISAVTEVFGPVNLREDITLQKLSELTIEVRKKVEGATEEERRTKKWLPFLLPPPSHEAYLLHESGMISPSSSPTTTASTPLISPSLRRLLDETSDLIDSPPFSSVLTQLLDAGFTHLTHNKIAPQAFRIPPVSASAERIVELVDPANAKTKIASTLPVYLRQAHAIGAGDVGGVGADQGLGLAGALTGVSEAGTQAPGSNEYLAAMEAVRELEAFAAVVYSSNFEYEVAEAAPEGDVVGRVERLEVPGGVESRPSTAGTGIWGMVGGGVGDERRGEVEEIVEVEPEEVVGGEESMVGAESGFEAAWGKATMASEEVIPLAKEEALVAKEEEVPVLVEKEVGPEVVEKPEEVEPEVVEQPEEVEPEIVAKPQVEPEVVTKPEELEPEVVTKPEEVEQEVKNVEPVVVDKEEETEREVHVVDKHDAGKEEQEVKVEGIEGKQ
ncbi:Peroxin-3-domain-containing protein [Eremomyces bilateralis CBS 781.70]|uniref:Peroxin-3-domain-containing protein n=1 Tax=Eremomyces bilateralis CBS 781.70 TaxID=1392243 RepID=A0A6G1G277_9PEZI|nr:Peroxin-3-domain-containing protein [Eremomyces bilateralis CBS 781.70]KAF1812030.1 Peroxin-3-domain-containing protein [Eremomyces bilateralis CBS 781.70]